MASTVTIDGAWTLQNLDTAAVGRLHDGAFLQSLSTQPNTQYRAGVIPTVATQGNTTAVDYFTAQNSPTGMSVLVSPGNAVVANASRGPYVTSNASVRTLTVATSDPTNPRIDLVYIQVIDNPPDTGTTVPQVGIITGTPGASPAVPALPTNGVCIPLAQVRVNAGVSSVTNSNITDVRTSAGVGRGPRMMLPGDALTDPGYCYGELRQRQLSSYPAAGFNSIVTDFWGFDSKWHGLKELTIAKPSQTGSGALGAGSTATIASITIPDPGWAYHIESGGLVDFGAASGLPTAPAALQASINVDSTTLNTNAISQAQASSVTSGAGTDYNCVLPVGRSDALTPNGYTGSHVLSFVAKNTSGGSMTIYNGPSGNGGVNYQFFIKIVPV